MECNVFQASKSRQMTVRMGGTCCLLGTNWIGVALAQWPNARVEYDTESISLTITCPYTIWVFLLFVVHCHFSIAASLRLCERLHPCLLFTSSVILGFPCLCFAFCGHGLFNRAEMLTQTPRET
jgi:hypothetical protein